MRFAARLSKVCVLAFACGAAAAWAACAGAGSATDPLQGINFDADYHADDGGDAADAALGDVRETSIAESSAESGDSAFAEGGDSGSADVVAETGTGDGSSAGDAADAAEERAGEAGGDSAMAEASTCSVSGFAGVLATYDLTGQPGNEASAPATMTATGVTAADLSRSSNLTPIAGAGSINSTNWPTSATADPGTYYTFTVTPPAGCTLSLTSLAIGTRASTDGPAAGDVATSADGFSSHQGSIPGTGGTTIALSATSAGAIEVRIYGYQALASTGSFRVESTLTLSGSLN